MIGRTIAHYEVLEKIGEGGMGAVYKARDTHLDRFVAIKVLPADRVANVERKRRFAQEARSASALNHPNIITIHDIDEAGGTEYIVMEFVDGKDLAAVIPRHGLRLDEVLKYAIQIADALAAAHAVGIVHRDFKPGNVMVRPDGRVKVLDFGLAKLVDDEVSGEDLTLSPADRPQTAEGTLVGTAAYMSPEQAEGRAVDARSDIFSFGAVLYEMLTGRRAFHGDSQVSTLAAVLRSDPRPASQIVEGLPAEAERLVTRCLRKDPERRFQHMADLKVALQDLKEESDSGTLSPAAPALGRGARRAWPWAAGALALAALVVGGVLALREHGEAPPKTLTSVPLTADPGWERSPSFSPDGNQVTFSWGRAGEGEDIYIKLIGGGPPLRLTTDPAPDRFPAWSPDGRSIAFLRAREAHADVLLLPALGGLERKLGEIRSSYGSPVNEMAPYLAWLPDGEGLVTVDRTGPGESPGLVVLSVASGEKRPLTPPPPDGSDFNPAVSPDGRSLAFVRSATLGASVLYVLSLTPDGRADGEPRPLDLPVPAVASPAWTTDGRALIVSAGRPFLGDARLWRAPVAGGKARPLGTGEDGVEPAISPRGGRLAYSVRSLDSNIWRFDLSGGDAGSNGERLIASTRSDITPQYSPDGSKIAFSSERLGPSEIWVCDRDGGNPVQITTLETFSGTPRWFPDGRRLVFDAQKEGQTDIHVVDITGGAPRRLTDDPSDDMVPSVSADGQSVLFASRRTGRLEIWRIPAAGGEAVQVTHDGGFMPFESPDGRAVYCEGPAAEPSEMPVPVYGLWRVGAAGEREYVTGPLLNFGYAVVDDGVYFIEPVGVDDTRLQFFDLAKGDVQTVLEIEGLARVGLSISPDRRYALVTMQERTGADLMLVEGFR
jgi:serine/threonine protein kinase/Tol biopolymer transport system component